MRREIARLLGGYATGTLTSEEREALFAAGLEDQEVFDALVREQPLRELLDDPAARAHLLASLDVARVPWYRRRLWLAPTLAAAACAMVAVGAWQMRRANREAAKPPILTAMQRETPPPLPAVAPLREEPAKQVAPVPAGKPPAARRIIAENFKRQVVVPSALATPPPRAAAPLAMPPAPSPNSAPPPVEAGAGAALVAQNSPVRAEVLGTVRDASGATIPGALVTLANPQTDSVLKATTDQSGGFHFFDVQGGKYSLTAESKGFKDYSTDVPVDGNAPRMVNAILQMGVATQAVDVTNMAAVEQVRAELAAYANLSWTIWRRQTDGQAAKADPNQLMAGETVDLRLESRLKGYVTVLDTQANAAPLVTAKQIEPGKPLDMAILPAAAGRRDLRVVFTPQLVAGAAKMSMARSSAGKQSAPQPAARTLTITLNYK